MLYYSHVNEDSAIERTLLADGKYPLVVAVAGSGERVLALMEDKCVESIVAIDLNKEALFLLELKLAALVTQTVENYLVFVGHLEAKRGFRTECFEQAKPHLTPNCISYWERRLDAIENGILISGHFERFIARVRPLLNRFLGQKIKRVLSDRYFQPDIMQKTKWKVTTWFFSKKWIYTLLGNKDIAFTGKGSAPEIIPAALNLQMENRKTFSSFIAHLIFNGHLRNMDASYLPSSLQKEVLTNIRQRLIKKEIRVEYRHQDLLEFVEKQNADAPLTFYSASDILSFETHEYVLKLFQTVLSRAGNLVVIRAFLRNRLSPLQLKSLAGTYGRVKQLDEIESSRMYQVIAVGSLQPHPL